MRVVEGELEVQTAGRGLVDITRRVEAFVGGAGVRTGLCHVFVQHTSASLLIQENADPSVRADLVAWLDALAPEDRRWSHDAEGPDDMPAHAKAAITRTGETLPVREGRLALGTWQGIYLAEHRARPHRRRIVLTLLGVSG